VCCYLLCIVPFLIAHCPFLHHFCTIGITHIQIQIQITHLYTFAYIHIHRDHTACRGDRLGRTMENSTTPRGATATATATTAAITRTTTTIIQDTSEVTFRCSNFEPAHTQRYVYTTHVYMICDMICDMSLGMVSDNRRTKCSLQHRYNSAATPLQHR
jgi:hypothetical protein